MMSSSSSLRQRLLSDYAATDDKRKEISKEQQQPYYCDNVEQSQHKHLNVSSLILGLIVGVLLQFSTLGINWLVITICGNSATTTSSTDGDPSDNKSTPFNFSNYNTKHILIYSLIWSLLTSGISLWILKFLRDLLTIGSSLTTKESSSVSFNRPNKLLNTLILDMESRFVAGALFGVCSAWTITDYVLGLHIQMIYSLITMIVASFWGYFLLRYFSFDEDEDENNNDQKEETKTISLSADDNVILEPSKTNNDLLQVLIV